MTACIGFGQSSIFSPTTTMYTWNTADEALIIDQIDISPKVLAIVVKEHGDDLLSRMNASVEAMFGDETEERTFSVLRPLEERSFRLIVLKSCNDLKDNERIRIRCDWRTTRRPWPFIRSVSVITTPTDFVSYLIASRPTPTPTAEARHYQVTLRQPNNSPALQRSDLVTLPLR
jgi:hypothetical protein